MYELRAQGRQTSLQATTNSNSRLSQPRNVIGAIRLCGWIGATCSRTMLPTPTTRSPIPAEHGSHIAHFGMFLTSVQYTKSLFWLPAPAALMSASRVNWSAPLRSPVASIVASGT